ncbi:hydrogenase maturation protease [uncultured Gimesia sp.]|uniref:hydrogenase maturation protease n=1 Tax=uncultured Gimesia sp. TaxID=1678688 RepID=UPI0030DC9F17|tara:strand:- start:123130 stop:123606 length:477 start_codon:yes stop_codon:yes gene_type:complete
MKPETMIAGIGSPHGDDRVGWEIANAIQSRTSDRASVRLVRTPDELLDWLEGIQELVICDACQGAGEVGSVHQWEWPCADLESISWSGTHNLSLLAVLALARQLDRLPASVWIWGVEVQQVQPDQPMSNAVMAGATSAAESICKALSIPQNETEKQHA